jgi:glycosyltransferase involved in cell wall biosynthesis
LQEWFSCHPAPDIVFVPTVLTPHLLAWALLIKMRKAPGKILLFFPNLAIALDQNCAPFWISSPSTKIMRLLFHWLSPEINAGKVVIGVETQPMRRALSSLISLPVKYFPHPVPSGEASSVPRPHCIRAACYGIARHEKGSDLLQEAVSLLLQAPSIRPLCISYQWLGDFADDRGRLISVPAHFESDARIHVLRKNFDSREYEEQLAATDLMILPYRARSYGLRVSRLAIEAMTLGIPMVVTEGTTMEEQSRMFGAAVTFPDGDCPKLAAAIRQAVQDWESLQELALSRRLPARDHFSVAFFRAELFPETN